MNSQRKDILKILCHKEELMEQIEEIQAELEAINMTLRTFGVAT